MRIRNSRAGEAVALRLRLGGGDSEDGALPPGAAVCIAGASSGPPLGCFPQAGPFELAGLAPGTHAVSVAVRLAGGAGGVGDAMLASARVVFESLTCSQ